MLEQFVKVEWDIPIFPGIAKSMHVIYGSDVHTSATATKIKVFWIKVTTALRYTRNSGTRAWLVQEYLSILAKGRREDAPRRKHCAWHHADSRCSGLACDKSNVTAVHCAVVGAFKFNQDWTLSQARDDRSDRSTCNILCFRVLGWRIKKHVVQHCMFRIQPFMSVYCVWIMKANMVHKVADP